jgi:hypothetical protein
MLFIFYKYFFKVLNFVFKEKHPQKKKRFFPFLKHEILKYLRRKIIIIFSTRLNKIQKNPG